MLLARVNFLEHTVQVTDWRAAAPWMGLTVLVVASGAGILRAAVIIHNKRMLRDPESQGIAVPGWPYASVVMCVTLLVDAALVPGIAWGTADHWRIEWFILAFVLRLPIHAAVLAWLLSASLREAMIVQVFEIAIMMAFTPVAAALLHVALIR
jgi:hypothetical protein